MLRITTDSPSYVVKDDILYDKECSRLIHAFSDLKTIVIDSSVKKIEHSAFRGSNNLSNIIVHSEINEIGGYAFSYCQNLNNVIINAKMEIIPDGLFRGSGIYEFDIPTETLEQVTLEVPNFLSQTPSTEPPTEVKTEPPQASVENLLSGLIPVINEAPIDHSLEVNETPSSNEEFVVLQQSSNSEQIALPNVLQAAKLSTEQQVQQLVETMQPQEIEQSTEVTTEQTEVLTLEKLDTTVEEDTEEERKSVLSTDIQIKGPAGINAEPLLPQF